MKGKAIEVRFGGFGGQGIILAGFLLGKAYSIYDEKNAVFTQSYGPEARGGACSAGVLLSTERVDYPKVQNPDVLIVMSQEAYTTYIGTLREGGTLIYDEDLVKIEPDDEKRFRVFPVPATRIAEDVGKRIVANVVMLGAFAKITGLVSKEAMVESIKTSVKPDFVELNLRALEEGYDRVSKRKVEV